MIPLPSTSNSSSHPPSSPKNFPSMTTPLSMISSSPSKVHSEPLDPTASTVSLAPTSTNNSCPPKSTMYIHRSLTRSVTSTLTDCGFERSKIKLVLPWRIISLRLESVRAISAVRSRGDREVVEWEGVFELEGRAWEMFSCWGVLEWWTRDQKTRPPIRMRGFIRKRERSLCSQSWVALI